MQYQESNKHLRLECETPSDQQPELHTFQHRQTSNKQYILRLELRQYYYVSKNAQKIAHDLHHLGSLEKFLQLLDL